MKPWMPFQIQSVSSWEELRRFCSQGFQNLYTLMNGNVGFTDNINCTIVDTTILTTATAVPHNLGKVPFGFLILNLNQSATIWSPSTTIWTDTNIYLIASSNVNVRVAVLGG